MQEFLPEEIAQDPLRGQILWTGKGFEGNMKEKKNERREEREKGLVCTLSPPSSNHILSSPSCFPLTAPPMQFIWAVLTFGV